VEWVSDVSANATEACSSASPDADGFDAVIIAVYITYLSFRVYGLKSDSAWARETGIDVLAIGMTGADYSEISS
jgi:hypothetical protein